jgi:succinate-semialdehyde dehydrogenase/glutarate-semialdehyde dehydrogenase
MLPVPTKEDIIQKIALAKKTQKERKNSGLSKRMKILREIHTTFETHTDKIAILITQEMGKPITQAESEVKTSLTYLQWDIDNAENYLSPEITIENDKEIHKVYFEPKGVVVSITPFNYPFSLFVQQTFQNLLVGNVVINKPDPTLPALYTFLEELIYISSLPKGVQQFVYGGSEVGSFLVEQDIDMICFT